MTNEKRDRVWWLITGIGCFSIAIVHPMIWVRAMLWVFGITFCLPILVSVVLRR
jgi:hypothetical protein